MYAEGLKAVLSRFSEQNCVEGSVEERSSMPYQIGSV